VASGDRRHVSGAAHSLRRRPRRSDVGADPEGSVLSGDTPART
jgi:hypothetical protein